MDNVNQIAIIACWALSIAGLAAYAVSVAGEITYVTLADGRRAERRLPFIFRLLLPLTPNFSRVVSGASFAKARANAESMLVASGLEGVLSGREFLALKMLMPIVAGGIWCLFVALVAKLLPSSPVAGNSLVLMLFGVIGAYAYPLYWLRTVLKRRHTSILKSLPFVLDLLTLGVEAGMDFMGALQRNCESRPVDALNEELIRMSHEIRLGITRRRALENLAARVQLGELSSVVHALVQADELGVSIGSILRIQSEQIRSRRFERAEKLANEAPVKMLGPLLLFIFPAVFIILLSPVFMQAAKNIF